MDGIQQIAAQYGPQIPPIMGIDSVHGAAYIEGAAVFPHQIGLAASFDREQVRKVAQTTAKDMRQVGLHWNFAPILDVAVNPMWPRSKFALFAVTLCECSISVVLHVANMRESSTSNISEVDRSLALTSIYT
jgi:hypothetical protein